MYYKIENKECEVYKQLYEQRIKEQQIEIKNTVSILEKTGLYYVDYFGRSGQQNFRRVSSYTGFEFTEPEKVDLKIWKRHQEHNEIFIPNSRTKLGREMKEFLSNGLEGSNYNIINKILKLKDLSRFVFPFIEIVDELIIIYLDEQHDPKDVNLIEITKAEFNSYLNIK